MALVSAARRPALGLDDSRALELELRSYRNPVDQQNAEKLARARCRVSVPTLDPPARQAALFEVIP